MIKINTDVIEDAWMSFWLYLKNHMSGFAS